MSIQQLLAAYSGASSVTPDDPYFSDVSLLLHCEGADGSTTFTDSSANAASITVGSGCVIATAQYKYGSASGYFPGTSGAYLLTPTGSEYGFTADYTVEGFKRSGSLGSNNCCLFDSRSGGQGIAIYASANDPAGINRLVLANNSAGIAGYGTTAFTADTWQHWAVSRQGSTTRGFIDGVEVWSVTDSRTLAASTRYSIGAVYDGAQRYNGYLDEVRVTIGRARYTANFTPPSQAFPDS